MISLSKFPGTGGGGFPGGSSWKAAVLVISSFLFLFYGCSNKEDSVTYIYRAHYFKEHKGFNDLDTLVLKKLTDSSYLATSINNDPEKKFYVVQNNNYIKVGSKDSLNVLFSLIDDSVHYNNQGNNDGIPYFVEDSKLLLTKYFEINKTNYLVGMFRVRNYSSNYRFMYYSPDFGFLCYVDSHVSYKRLEKLINVTSSDKKIAMELTDAVIKDSSFFAYPHPPILKPMKFTPP